MSVPTTAVFLLLAVLLDRYAGDGLRRLVPLGAAASVLHGCFESGNHPPRRSDGLLAMALLVFPVLWLVFLLQDLLPPGGWWLVEVLGLYWAFGLASLQRDALAVQRALVLEETDTARRALAGLVDGLEPEADARAVARRTTTMVLQRSTDALFGPLFWWLLAGLPAALGYRLLVLLVERWGRADGEEPGFSWAAVRFHAWIGWIPAWLTAMTFVLVGRSAPAFAALRAAGPDLDTGNRALLIRTGWAAMEPEADRIGLGGQTLPDWLSISRSLALVRRAAFVWVVFVLVTALLAWAAQGALTGAFDRPVVPV